MYAIGLQALRAKIRGFHVAGSTISARISKAKGKRRERLWRLKHELGTHARYHLIAYGLLRGKAYDQIERCAPNNRPNPQAVLAIMQDHDPNVRHTVASLGAILLPAAAPTMAHEKAA